MAEQKKNYQSSISEKNNGFFITEAYKTIRTNLQFTIATSGDNVAMITSFEPNAGKSITAANISITTAQLGDKVLLIDADVRNASQHKVFNVHNTNGLTTLLSGLSKPDDNVFHKNIRPNLDLLTAGPMPPNLSELLCSKNMHKLLETLRGVYDYIFIDCPPIGVVSDALSLLTHAKNIALIVRQDQTRHSDIRHSISSIKALDGNLLGVIITDVPNEGSLFSGKYGRYNRYNKYGKYGRYGKYYRYSEATTHGVRKYIDASADGKPAATESKEEKQ
ncbi:MAG: CpsD/CapB family tyrosine-protein kinase [Clostridia bacterium]|nr:CpsD/CapB family tyrosine-protein kinase [Clostridia bacterium]